MISAQKGPLLAYYGTLAVFGAWAAGSPAAAATAKAIAERLAHLGLGSRAEPWATWLCLADAYAP